MKKFHPHLFEKDNMTAPRYPCEISHGLEEFMKGTMMKRLVYSLLLPVVTASLLACGGSEEDSSGTQLPANDTAVVGVSNPDEQVATQRSATWISMSDDVGSMGKRLASHGISAAAPGANSLSSMNKSNAADGVLLNVDNAPANWQQEIRRALKAGKTVVLVASGDGKKLHDATLELTGIGVGGANAVMILQGNPDEESFGLLPFHDEEAAELAEMMASATHR